MHGKSRLTRVPEANKRPLTVRAKFSFHHIERNKCFAHIALVLDFVSHIKLVNRNVVEAIGRPLRVRAKCYFYRIEQNRWPSHTACELDFVAYKKLENFNIVV